METWEVTGEDVGKWESSDLHAFFTFAPLYLLQFAVVH